MRKTLKYLGIFFPFFLGIVIGIFIGEKKELSLLETVSLIDVATLITTVFLAVYIPEVIDKNHQIRKDKKQLLEDRIHELQTMYRKTNQFVQQELTNKQGGLIVGNTLDLCQNRIQTIAILTEYIDQEMKLSLSKEFAPIIGLSQQYQALLAVEQLEEGGLIYPDDIRAKEEALYSEIDRATSLFIFKLRAY